MGVLSGKAAVVTGGSRGLGLGISRALAQAGASVVLASRSQKSVDEAVQQIISEGGNASGIAADVVDLEQVEHLAEVAVTQYGKLDIWVNNAGTAGPYGPTMGFTPQDFYLVTQTNTLGVFNGSRSAMHYFLQQGSGKLINLLGHGYRRPVPWQNAYSSSKAWVRAFTKSLAEETKDSGVGVFAYNPGMVLTELLTDVDVIEGSEHRLKVYPTIVRMLAKPVEVPAQKVVWIASSATDGKTGQVINLQSTGAMFGSALKEGLRHLANRPASDMGIRVKVIPAYRKETR